MKILIKCASIFLMVTSVAYAQSEEGAHVAAQGLCIGRTYSGYRNQDFTRFHGGSRLNFNSFAASLCRSGVPVRCVLDHLNDERISISSANRKLSFVKEHCENETIDCVVNLIGSTDSRIRPNEASRVCGDSSAELLSACMVRGMSLNTDLKTRDARRNCQRCHNDIVCLNHIVEINLDPNLCPFATDWDMAYMRPRETRVNSVVQFFGGGRGFANLLQNGKIEMRTCPNYITPTSPSYQDANAGATSGSGSALDD